MYVNLDRARQQARDYGVSPLGTKLARLVIHGTLHLTGYDDRTPRQAARMQAARGPVPRPLFARAHTQRNRMKERVVEILVFLMSEMQEDKQLQKSTCAPLRDRGYTTSEISAGLQLAVREAWARVDGEADHVRARHAEGRVASCTRQNACCSRTRRRAI